MTICLYSTSVLLRRNCIAISSSFHFPPHPTLRPMESVIYLLFLETDKDPLQIFSTNGIICDLLLYHPFYCQIFYCMEVPHSINSLFDEHLGVYPFWLLSTMLLWTTLYKIVCGCMLLIFLDMQLEIELLCRMVTLYLIFWGTANIFTKWLQHFIFPRTKYKRSDFSSTLPALIWFLPIVILVSVKQHLTVILICVSLMTNNIKHLLRGLLVSVYPFYALKKYLLNTLSEFFVLFTVLWEDSQMSYIINKYFLPSWVVSFHFLCSVQA